MDSIKYDVPADFAANSHVNNDQYLDLYQQSVTDPETFWGEMGQRLDWIKPYVQVKDVSYARDDLHINWYQDGTLNASVNCIDRHLPERAAQTAILFEGDEPTSSKNITYQNLYDQVCRFANVLKSRGVKKGDRVTIYMPMIPEAVYAMLACARIGAVHSVVFGGFSPEALAGRIEDCDSHVVITADQGIRGGRAVALKTNVDEALDKDGVDVTT